jgi:hypothetical protein
MAAPSRVGKCTCESRNWGVGVILFARAARGGALLRAVLPCMWRACACACAPMQVRGTWGATSARGACTSPLSSAWRSRTRWRSRYRILQFQYAATQVRRQGAVLPLLHAYALYKMPMPMQMSMPSNHTPASAYTQYVPGTIYARASMYAHTDSPTHQPALALRKCCGCGCGCGCPVAVVAAVVLLLCGCGCVLRTVHGARRRLLDSAPARAREAGRGSRHVPPCCGPGLRRADRLADRRAARARRGAEAEAEAEAEARGTKARPWL